MKKILFILFLGISTSLYSQHVLESHLNMFRVGDEIIKQQVEYKNPGRSGENVLWDFGSLNTVNEEYSLTYSENQKQQLIGTEHQTMYYYTLSGDSLLGWGYENPTTLMINEQPELLMKFPVRYKDSTFSYYNANGKYCDRLRLSAMGTVISQADAYGMMVLPGKDTIRNVIRVHSIKKIADGTEPFTPESPKGDFITLPPQNSSLGDLGISPDSINFRLANDTVYLELETYRWYVKGYRYPIFETVKSITNRKGEERNFFDVAFFYPPQEHYYLEKDFENMALHETEINPSDPEPETDTNPWKNMTYNVFPNPVITNLAIEVYLPKAANQVRMQLTDKIGQTVSNENWGAFSEGIFDKSIFMSNYPPGEYVLNIWLDGYNAIAEKILKK